MPSPVQSNCDAHDTIANGQYGAVWSMGQTQQNAWKKKAQSSKGFDLLQNLPSDSSDALTDNSSDVEVQAQTVCWIFR
ncbi:hypothetical protein TNCV_3152261 [Trichonephila clavipes]|nr:hypothetical protein TNCV_3152261 [Trichonephila clavipes]